MNSISKYIAFIPLAEHSTKHTCPKHTNLSLGFEKNGSITPYVQDTSELGEDTTEMLKKGYGGLIEESFPNSARINLNQYGFWLSMFGVPEKQKSHETRGPKDKQKNYMYV